jgi:hypothetical protein
MKIKILFQNIHLPSNMLPFRLCCLGRQHFHPHRNSYDTAGAFSERYELIKKKKVVVVVVCDTLWIKTSKSTLRRNRHNEFMIDCKVVATIRNIILVWITCKN